MVKVTFSLDDESVAYLERMADRLDMPKSQVVREALRTYGEQMARLSEEERVRLLNVFDTVTPVIPDRPRHEVDAEVAAVRHTRTTGGRRAGGDPPPDAEGR